MVEVVVLSERAFTQAACSSGTGLVERVEGVEELLLCSKNWTLSMRSRLIYVSLVTAAHSTSHRTCLTLAVSSCTRWYTERSSRIRRAILEVAWMTVVWSRPPNSLPIFGSSVSSLDRYIATWRG